MRVELARALSVLSHEMRGPLGVLQGYLRMLRDGVADEPTERRMLQAMQDATGRLTQMARDASSIAAWQENRQPDDAERLTVRELLGRIEAHVAGKVSTRVITDADVDGVLLRSQPAGSLPAALGAVLQAAIREAPGSPFALRAALAPDDAGGISLTMAPDDDPPAPPSPAAPFAFDGGGAGLALVLAFHVLEAHGADVTVAAAAPSRVTVRLSSDGGIQ